MAGTLAFAATRLTLHLRDVTGDQSTITLVNAAAMLLFSLVLMLLSREYSAPKRLSTFPAIGILARDTLLGAAGTAFLSYVTKGFFTGLTSPSRLALGVTIGSFFVLGCVARVGLGALQRRQYEAGQGVRRVLIAGDGRVADELLQIIGERPEMGVAVVGRLRLDVPEWRGVSAESTLPALTIRDDMDGLREFDLTLRSSRASEVIIALDPENQSVLPRLADFLDIAHVPYRVVPSLFEETYRTTELLRRSEIPVVDLQTNPLDRLGRTAKRAADLVFSSLALILLSPLLLAITLTTVATSGMPVIFAQERVGKNGRRFMVYKFRTMVKDAEARLKELEQQNELAESNGRMFKIRRDPRVTRVGGVLRKLSLDELPQFFNVLSGDMSVVGPRPPLPREVAHYERTHLYRLRVLPGITGLWQVSGRNDLSFDDMVALDRYYVDNWSLWLDLNIVLKTFWVMVSRKGAC